MKLKDLYNLSIVEIEKLPSEEIEIATPEDIADLFLELDPNDTLNIQSNLQNITPEIAEEIHYSIINDKRMKAVWNSKDAVDDFIEIFKENQTWELLPVQVRDFLTLLASDDGIYFFMDGVEGHLFSDDLIKKFPFFDFIGFKDSPENIKKKDLISLKTFIEKNRKVSFQQKFIEKLIEFKKNHNLENIDFYKKAGIDRRVFSSIMKNKDYIPSKKTAINLLFAFEMNIKEAKEFLALAGLSFSENDIQDLIFQYFIMKGEYDILKINQILSSNNLPLLGNILE